MASRKILEKEAQSAALHAVKTGESMVAESAVAFVTHPDNPVKALTLEQLRKICLGEITTWADVGGPSEPIQVITTLPDSGTFTFLRFTLLDEGYFLSESKSKQYFRDIIREIAGRKPPSLGYVGMDDAIKAARNGFVRILALKKDADSPAVLPSPTTVRDRSYPIVQPLYFYWDEKRAPDVIQKFVDFCRKLNEAPKK
jgi:phosphate transport system substrate-binding protein